MKQKDKKTIKVMLKLVYYILFGWLLLIIWLIKKLTNKNKDTTPPQQYHSKELITKYEKYFFDIIYQEFSNNYFVMPQVNLATIIDKIKDFPNQYQNELNRNIDIGIFDKENMTPLLLIEINDKTHNQHSRIERDKKVKQICQIAQIPLITFYSDKPNKKDYIIDRIKNSIKQ